MQENGKLVLGIDLCDDITQVTVMRPYGAEPDAVSFDVNTRKEYLPTLLCVGENGEWSISEGKETGMKVLPPFFHAATREEEVVCGEECYSARRLLERYVSLLLTRLKERFEGQEIGFIAVTCEEANTKGSVRKLLQEIFGEREGFGTQCRVFSHLEAFLQFVVRQEISLWENGSAAFDYATDGLLFYRMECRMAGGRRLLVTEYKDYSEVIPPGFITGEDTGQGALTFERLAAEELRQKVASLFVTGRGFEGNWVSDVLRLLSGGRRVFRGQNLYTQGACYAGTEIFRGESNADFAVLTPEQITADVYLVADSTEQEADVLLASAGAFYRDINVQLDLIFDGTDKLMLKVLPAGETTPKLLRFSPELSELRGNRTDRYCLRVFFVKRDVMVVQLKDTGFGAFYPTSYRIYEEVVDFFRWEQ